MNKQIDILVTTTIDAPRERCFAYIVPVSLSHIFHRYLAVPGVVRTDESQAWISPGLSRTVYFDDGSTAKEELLSVVHSDSFSYRITEMTGINKLLVTYIMGTWVFGNNGASTTIEWTYSLHARSAAACIVVKAFVAPMLRRFLQRALDVLKQDLDQPSIN